MDNIMLDLETMGNKPDAAIVAIGAVFFDLDNWKLGPKFYMNVDLQTAVDEGGTIDASTVLWWMARPDKARQGLSTDVQSIGWALQSFSRFIDEELQEMADTVKIWGNGADFDNSILASAYHRKGFRLPWQYYNNRCYRTAKNLFPGIEITRIGTHHNALDDAISQANHLTTIWQNFLEQ